MMMWRFCWLLVVGVAGLVEVRERFAVSRDGQRLQWLSAEPAAPSSRPPVVLVHGTFHGAWCFAERWFEALAASGLEVHALSLRGTSASALPTESNKVTVRQHADDVEDAVAAIFGPTRKVSCAAHSFGGPVLFDLADRPAFRQRCAAVACLCSVPPSGNGGLTLRYLRRSPLDAWRITRAFAFKKAAEDVDVAQQIFFDGEVDDARARGYVERFAADSTARLDLADYLLNLPATTADGRAPWLDCLSAPARVVLGATRDFIVDDEAIRETANFLGLDAPIYVDAPHDVMLGRDAEAIARTLAAALP